MGIRLGFTGLADITQVMDRVVRQNKQAVHLLRVLHEVDGPWGKGLGGGGGGRVQGRSRFEIKIHEHFCSVEKSCFKSGGNLT